MVSTLTTRDLANLLKTDERRVRRFLRSRKSPIPPCGKGNRYLIDARQVATLKRQFKRWELEYQANARPRRPMSGGFKVTSG